MIQCGSPNYGTEIRSSVVSIGVFFKQSMNDKNTACKCVCERRMINIEAPVLGGGKGGV